MDTSIGREGGARRRRSLSGAGVAVALALTGLLPGCRDDGADDRRPGPAASANQARDPAQATQAAPAAQAAQAAQTAKEASGCTRLKPTGTGLSQTLVGPRGEPGVTASEIKVTAEDAAQAKAAVAGKTVAIAQHIGTADYTKQVVAGIEKELAPLGAKFVSSDASGEPARQVGDIENLIAQKPALLIVFPVDQSAATPGILAANRAGVPVIVVGSALKDAVEYRSLVSADDYQGGVIAADQLIRALDNEGDVAILPYKYQLWHVDQRVRGFRDGIKCSGLRLVEDKQTCTNTTDCTSTFADVLTAHPTLKGAFGAWDGMALGMNAAAQTAGWKGAITTSDLSLAAAQAIAGGAQALKATAAQLTDEQGRATGQLATLVLAGKEVPKMVFVADVSVEKDSAPAVYQRLFGKPLE